MFNFNKQGYTVEIEDDNIRVSKIFDNYIHYINITIDIKDLTIADLATILNDKLLQEDNFKLIAQTLKLRL